MNSCLAQRATAAFAGLLLFTGCASTYVMQSRPDGAQVFWNSPKGKSFLGQTPLAFSKSELPDEESFELSFECEGCESKTVSVSPNNDARTIIQVALKQRKGASQEAEARLRKVLAAIFEVQDFVARKKYVDGLATLRKLETEEPNLPEVHVMKGSLYTLLSDHEEARKAWEKAISMDSKYEYLRTEIAKRKETR